MVEKLLELFWNGNLPVDIKSIIDNIIVYNGNKKYKLSLDYTSDNSLEVKSDGFKWTIAINKNEIIYRQRIAITYGLIWILRTNDTELNLWRLIMTDIKRDISYMLHV